MTHPLLRVAAIGGSIGDWAELINVVCELAISFTAASSVREEMAHSGLDEIRLCAELCLPVPETADPAPAHPILEEPAQLSLE
eukprot:CAMPEP_0115183242 /NCGR_PEP_ID=MMETSP0270-20121206/8355_1 /TAXON_ID=71861 /ORGANISM="Scrippsiella trochoidea, Strain CCMP3099" /LENGTH=82 /DNA_ID=CAMNT_0002596309 /DNA_START=661 /DNA_END=909 /DNA_ORIENTATION=-